ncbi:MAG: hypothetical protein AB203_03485 [Parcubacteria bacterium C7867-008]|nr:MAG: hypothetical protein AB203_03485 [Parcubacteria bacterium C7867-008]
MADIQPDARAVRSPQQPQHFETLGPQQQQQGEVQGGATIWGHNVGHARSSSYGPDHLAQQRGMGRRGS